LAGLLRKKDYKRHYLTAYFLREQIRENRRSVGFFFTLLGLPKLKTGINRCGLLSRFQWSTFQGRISNERQCRTSEYCDFHPFSHRVSYREKPGFIYLHKFRFTDHKLIPTRTAARVVLGVQMFGGPSANMARLLYKRTPCANGR